MAYNDLSGQARDVLVACAALTDELECQMTGKQIRSKTAELRSETPTDYTYELISNLVNEGWLESTPDPYDERVTRYTLSGRAKTVISERGAMMVRCSSSLSEPESTSTEKEAEGNRDGRIKAPRDTVAAKVEDTPADAV